MACTTAGGWLQQRRGQVTHVDGSPLLPDDDDALAAIFTRLSDAADIVRCAATCRRWCRVVAKEAAVLSRALPAQLTRSRAFVGVFHQEDAGVTAPRKRKRGRNGSSAGQPCFVPTAAAARRLRIPSTTNSCCDDGHGELLEYARPVASRNGRVVLELRRDGHADGLKFCVLNPMTGEAALLPPLTGKDKPGCYAIALLTSDDDLERPPTAAFFFRVVIVYNRRSFTALRAYSSDTAQWSSEVQRRPKIDTRTLRELGQSAVLRGVAFWPLDRSALAVQLDAACGEPREVAMPPDGILVDTHHQHARLMAVVTTSTDQHGIGNQQQQQEELCFIEAGFHNVRSLLNTGLPCRTIVLVTTFLCVDDMSAGRWERRRQSRGIRLPPEMKVRSWDAVKLRCFCEKSGVVVFTVGQDSNCPGAYALDMATQRVEKMAEGAACDAWRNVVGYEMDAPACLASMACY